MFPSMTLFEIVVVAALVVWNGLLVFVVVFWVEIVVLPPLPKLKEDLGVEVELEAKEMEAKGFFRGCGGLVASEVVPGASVGTVVLVIEYDGGFGVLVLAEVPFLALHFLSWQ